MAKKKVGNKVLQKKILERFSSVAKFCEAYSVMGITNTEVGKLIALKASPFRQKCIQKDRIYEKEYRSLPLKLEKALNFPVECLFPEKLYENCDTDRMKGGVEIISFSRLSASQRREFFSQSEPNSSPVLTAEFRELRKRIDDLLEKFFFRDREIFKHRRGLGDGYVYTLDELAQMFGITRERVRQIEDKISKEFQELAASKLESFLS